MFALPLGFFISTFMLRGVFCRNRNYDILTWRLTRKPKQCGAAKQGAETQPEKSELHTTIISRRKKAYEKAKGNSLWKWRDTENERITKVRERLKNKRNEETRKEEKKKTDIPTGQFTVFPLSPYFVKLLQIIMARRDSPLPGGACAGRLFTVRNRNRRTREKRRGGWPAFVRRRLIGRQQPSTAKKGRGYDRFLSCIITGWLYLSSFLILIVYLFYPFCSSLFLASLIYFRRKATSGPARRGIQINRSKVKDSKTQRGRYEQKRTKRHASS